MESVLRRKQDPTSRGSSRIVRFKVIFLVPIELFQTIEAGQFKSTLDFPIICIFDDLMKMHPNAKVLLTVRDSPEAWVKSFRTSVWRVMQMPSWIQVNQLLGGPPGVLGNRQFTVDLHDKCFEIICKKVTLIVWASKTQHKILLIINQGNTVAEKKVKWNRNTVTDIELGQESFINQNDNQTILNLN